MANFLDQLATATFAGDFRPPAGSWGRWILEAPEAVKAHHRECLEAGAQVIRTATWGLHPIGLASHGLADRVNEINWTAARIAVEAAEDSGAKVCGWVGPSGCPAEQAATGFREQLGALLDGGCRLMLFEGFSDLAEMEIAVETLRELHHCPAIVLAPGEAGPETVTLWAKRAEGVGADLFGAWFSEAGGMPEPGSVVAWSRGLPTVTGPGLYFGGEVTGDRFRAWAGRLAGALP